MPGKTQPQSLPEQILIARLREAREYIGLKQDEVARHLSVPRTAISEIENGKRELTALELSKVASLYQRPVGWFTGESSTASIPPNIEFLARATNGLSANDMTELGKFSDYLRAKSKSRKNDAS